MISVDVCREIIKKHNYNIDNEEIKKLREFLYMIAEQQINIELKNKWLTYERITLLSR